MDNSSAKIFPPDCLLIAMYGATAGKVSLLKIPACTNQAVCAVIPTSLYLFFLRFAFSDLYPYLVNLSSGSARDNLSQDLIKKLTFVIPTEEIIKSFNKILNPLLEQIPLNLQQNQQLTQLRDWLLPLLMNGQVRVE